MRKFLSVCTALGWTLLSVSAVGISVVPVVSDARPSGFPHHRRVLMIGIDGCRTDALLAAETPHLDRLISTGVFATHTDIVGPRDTGAKTVSGPGWASILTGVCPDRHGIQDNRFLWTYMRQQPHLFHRINAACPRAQMLVAHSWGPISNEIVQLPNITSDYSSESNYADADGKVTQTVITALKTRDPDVIFAYFGNVDATGHTSGFHPHVRAYARAIERVDAQIGRILDAVEERKIKHNEEWLIVVCTDHGGRALGHYGGRKYPEIGRVFTIYNSPLLMPRRVETTTYLVDIAPMVLQHLGIPVDPDWQLDGRTIQERVAAAQKSGSESPTITFQASTAHSK